MKKALNVTLAMLAMLAIAACGSDSDDAEDGEDTLKVEVVTPDPQPTHIDTVHHEGVEHMDEGN